MKKWEYKVIWIDPKGKSAEDTEGVLQRWGGLGYELVAITHKNYWVFKRPKS